MIINTYTPSSLLLLKDTIYPGIVAIAKQALIAVLFAIGASLSLKVIKEVGAKPLIQAILLWIIIGVSSLFVCLYTIE